MPTETTLVPLPTHPIARGRLDRNAGLAQVRALEEGLAQLRVYLTSPTATRTGFVHVSEVLVRLSETLSAGTEAREATYRAARVVNCPTSGTPMEEFTGSMMDYRCPQCARWLRAAVVVPPFWPDHAPSEAQEEDRANALGKPPGFGAETMAARYAAIEDERAA